MRLLLLCFSLLIAACAAQVHDTSPPPEFALTPDEQAEVKRMRADLAAGYQTPYLSVDRPAVLAHYLREISSGISPDEAGLRSYEIRFGLLTNRTWWRTQPNFTDPRLDWDIWNAYLRAEGLAFTGAWDLLTEHLRVNVDAILSDARRRDWWMQRIFSGVQDWRRAAMVLYMAGMTDAVTAGIETDLLGLRAPDFRRRWATYVSTPSHPFVALLGLELPPELVTFARAIATLAATIRVRWQGWSIDDSRLPLSRAREFPAAFVFKAQDQLGEQPVCVFDGYAWSSERDVRSFPSHWQMIERTEHNVALDLGAEDGLFLHCYNGVLYAWPRERMLDAALRIANLAGWIADEALPDFYARGFKPMKVTHEGERR